MTGSERRAPIRARWEGGGLPAAVAGVAVLAAGCAGEIVYDDRPSPDAAAVEPETCHEWLEVEGVDFSPADEAPGVEDPVTVYPPIGGVHYRVEWRDVRRETMFMDCELAQSLARAAPFFLARDIVEVVDMGIYNYRCIGGGDPADGCPSGISQHAFALAIDIAGFATDGGDYASVLDDWIIDEGAETCASEPEGDNNAMLHELICELKRNGVWNIVLTPNYNDAHRDHFHVDLKEDSDFIQVHGGGVDVGGAAH